MEERSPENICVLKGAQGVGMVENVSKCFEYTTMPSLHKINTIRRKCENITC